jgi:hypothetical protein
MTRIVAFVVALAAVHVTIGAAPGPPPAEGEDRAEGVLRPVGPPSAPPERTDAGGECVVDLVQRYELSGTLSGAATVDYRILVHGPCGSPPGTFAEEWIARGTLKGALSQTEVTATLTYVASVAVGGEVEGEMTLGDGVTGVLQISGQFAERQLGYSGWAR